MYKLHFLSEVFLQSTKVILSLGVVSIVLRFSDDVRIAGSDVFGYPKTQNLIHFVISFIGTTLFLTEKLGKRMV